MIVGIASVRNEEAIIARSVSHLLAVGADHVIVSDGHSTDRTADILEGFDRVSLFDQDGPFDQPAETLRLAGFAREMDATWVVPFDADEFWTDLTPLSGLPTGVGKVYATVYGHRDWQRRHVSPRGLPKVAFREATAVQWGNHDADTAGGSVQGFEIRELQYQSFDHFLAKIEKSRELYEASQFSEVFGSHMRALVAMSDGQRVEEWDRLCSVPCVVDPIPYRGGAS